jgi:hypothetical protein
VTKMTAAVHVEFELLEGQANNTATTALIGGVGALKFGDRTWSDGHRSNWSETGHGSGKYCGSEDHLIAATAPIAGAPTGLDQG